jgi:hypothetical protein
MRSTGQHVEAPSDDEVDRHAIDRHAIDRHGPTFIPASNWPFDREGAPGDLELLRRFCNTVNLENGADRFATAHSVDAWLAELSRPPLRCSPRERRLLVEVRDGLRALLGPPSESGALVPALADVGFVVAADPTGVVAIRARRSGPHSLIAEVIDALLTAQRTGTWQRLKMCGHCHWMFYDRSKNAGGRWCTMQACGSRLKAKAYRSRQHRSS